MKNSEMSPLKHPSSVSAENKKSSEILHLGNRHESTRMITLTLKIVRGVPKKMSDFPFISIRKKNQFCLCRLIRVKIDEVSRNLGFYPFYRFQLFFLDKYVYFY